MAVTLLSKLQISLGLVNDLGGLCFIQIGDLLGGYSKGNGCGIQSISVGSLGFHNGVGSRIQVGRLKGTVQAHPEGVHQLAGVGLIPFVQGEFRPLAVAGDRQRSFAVAHEFGKGEPALIRVVDDVIIAGVGFVGFSLNHRNLLQLGALDEISGHLLLQHIVAGLQAGEEDFTVFVGFLGRDQLAQSVRLRHVVAVKLKCNVL